MRCSKRTYSITKDEDGSPFVMGRTDDIINVAGHRLSTRGKEEVLADAR
jgi:acyl-coenzyme A synthetase/AMP-(fatty) acid ligase